MFTPTIIVVAIVQGNQTAAATEGKIHLLCYEIVTPWVDPRTRLQVTLTRERAIISISF